MNTYAIVTQTLRNIREPEANRASVVDTLLDGINEGYMRVVAEVLQPYAWADVVTLDSDKSFLISSLSISGSAPFNRVQKVTKHRDYTEDSGWGESVEHKFELVSTSKIVVPTAAAGDQVYVRVLLSAPVLTMASNASDTTASTIPYLMPSEYQFALSHYAAAHLWETRAKFDKQAAALDKFFNAIDSMRQPRGTRPKTIKNVYKV